MEWQLILSQSHLVKLPKLLPNISIGNIYHAWEKLAVFSYPI